jgi:hypothetical protein
MDDLIFTVLVTKERRGSIVSGSKDIRNSRTHVMQMCRSEVEDLFTEFKELCTRSDFESNGGYLEESGYIIFENAHTCTRALGLIVYLYRSLHYSPS